MSEHRKALERIIALCEKSRNRTKRIDSIHDIALEALGVTKNQRKNEIEKGYEFSRAHANRVQARRQEGVSHE